MKLRFINVIHSTHKNYFHSICLNSLCTVYTRPHPPNLQQRWASKIQLLKKMSYFLTDFLEIKMRVQKWNCNWESALPLGWLLAWRIQDTWQCKGECPAHARHWEEKQVPARKSHLCTTPHLGPWGTAWFCGEHTRRTHWIQAQINKQEVQKQTALLRGVRLPEVEKCCPLCNGPSGCRREGRGRGRDQPAAGDPEIYRVVGGGANRTGAWVTRTWGHFEKAREDDGS